MILGLILAKARDTMRRALLLDRLRPRKTYAMGTP